MKEKILSLPKSFWVESAFFIIIFLAVGAFLQESFRIISFRDLVIAGIIITVFLILFEVYRR